MDWLNYHHLLYFWVVAKEGSVRKACDVLHLAQPTISGQLKQLETSLGVELFRREGRGLRLTAAGAVAFDYADDIFSLGQEFLQTIKGGIPQRPLRLRVGIPDVVPKLVAHRILAPAFDLDSPVHLICTEDKLESLVGGLATFSLDLVLADAPVAGAAPLRAFHHELGSSPLTVFAAPPLAREHRDGFPSSMARAPWLLPVDGTALRHEMDRWFEGLGIVPRVVAEFDDMALLKAFGADGAGVFVAPSAVEAEIRRQYRVEAVGTCEGPRERFYAISVERRITHPAIAAITDAARRELFA